MRYGVGRDGEMLTMKMIWAVAGKLGEQSKRRITAKKAATTVVATTVQGVTSYVLACTWFKTKYARRA